MDDLSVEQIMEKYLRINPATDMKKKIYKSTRENQQSEGCLNNKIRRNKHVNTEL